MLLWYLEISQIWMSLVLGSAFHIKHNHLKVSIAINPDQENEVKLKFWEK